MTHLPMLTRIEIEIVPFFVAVIVLVGGILMQKNLFLMVPAALFAWFIARVWAQFCYRIDRRK